MLDHDDPDYEISILDVGRERNSAYVYHRRVGEEKGTNDSLILSRLEDATGEFYADGPHYGRRARLPFSVYAALRYEPYALWRRVLATYRPEA